MPLGADPLSYFSINLQAQQYLLVDFNNTIITLGYTALHDRVIMNSELGRL
jgi:hypothetical protein